MATTTYATSAQCALYAGMKALTADSRPNESMIDQFRESAWVDVYDIIGVMPSSLSVQADIDKAKGAEMFLVKIMIDNVILKRNVVAVIPKEMEDKLATHFESFGIDSYEPNQDGRLTG